MYAAQPPPRGAMRLWALCLNKHRRVAAFDAVERIENRGVDDGAEPLTGGIRGAGRNSVSMKIWFHSSTWFGIASPAATGFRPARPPYGTGRTRRAGTRARRTAACDRGVSFQTSLPASVSRLRCRCMRGGLSLHRQSQWRRALSSCKVRQRRTIRTMRWNDCMPNDAPTSLDPGTVTAWIPGRTSPATFSRDVSTVQRWEKREGDAGPSPRAREARVSVYAFRSELDVWWRGRRSDLVHRKSLKRRRRPEAPSTARALACSRRRSVARDPRISGVVLLAVPRLPTKRGQSRRRSPEAQDSVLRARYLSVRTTDTDNQSAIALLEQCDRARPGFARAHAELASAYVTRLAYVTPDETRELEEKAFAAAEKALSIDPNVPEVVPRPRRPAVDSLASFRAREGGPGIPPRAGTQSEVGSDAQAARPRVRARRVFRGGAGTTRTLRSRSIRAMRRH